MSTSEIEIGAALSANTQAVLLLTAPLIVGPGESSKDLLTASEYRKLAQFLYDNKWQPADLIANSESEPFPELERIVNGDRLKRLVARGFLLSQAIERWQARSIWVVSTSDEEYPARLKERLKELAPPLLYGCGDSSVLNAGGLAVVGSRNADPAVLESAVSLGELAARAHRAIISGGARGIDQAAMSGALEAGGKAVGVLADSLERAALNRDHRNYLREGQLLLISPYDPQVGFNVGNAMQRNKLIYALADAAVVVQSDYQKGGTWAGAIEQLDKLRLVPIYILANPQQDTALEALGRKGALTWPNPTTPDDFLEALSVEIGQTNSLDNGPLLFEANNDPSANIPDHKKPTSSQPDSSEPDIPRSPAPAQSSTSGISPAEQLFSTVRSLLSQLDQPRTDKEIAAELEVTTGQVKEWLKRLVKDGTLEKLSAPTRYRSTKNSKLF
jgi:predicted Rossmann fold nucleotide-binding protein DprA/Smf involved in DNA uptake